MPHGLAESIVLPGRLAPARALLIALAGTPSEGGRTGWKRYMFRPPSLARTYLNNCVRYRGWPICARLSDTASALAAAGNSGSKKAPWRD